MAVKTGAENTRALWSECERQVFAVAGTNSVQYEQITVAVRALTDEMRDIASIEQLLESWENARELLLKAADAKGFSVSAIPWEKVSGAAFSLREREINQQTQRQARLTRILDAQQSGDDWVVFGERGDLDTGLLDPYRSTEMHVVSGFAIISMVLADFETGAPNYVVAVVRLDPKIGDLLDEEPGIMDWKEHGERNSFRASQQVARDTINTLARKNSL